MTPRIWQCTCEKANKKHQPNDVTQAAGMINYKIQLYFDHQPSESSHNLDLPISQVILSLIYGISF